MTKLMEHPDANLLAAFAERALSGAERVSVLGHLADCARCRQIVFLAQEAAGEETATVIVPKPMKSRMRWMRWSVAVVSAVLLATVGVTSWQVYERMQQDKSGVASETVAKVTPEQQQTLTMVEKQQNEAVSNTSVHAPVSAGPVAKGKSAESTFAAAPIEMKRNEGYSHAIGSVGASPLLEVKPQERKFAAPQQAQSLIGQEQHLEEQKVQKAVAASAYNDRAFMVSSAERSGGSAQAAPPMKAANVEVNGMAAPAAARQTTTVEVSSAPAQMLDTTQNSYTAEVSQENALQAKKAGARPGRKPLADSLIVGGSYLTLDTSGKLFVSSDSGVHWREIKKQWKGKATTLTLTQDRNAALLWCDDGRTWISKNGGVSWQPYDAPKQKPMMQLDESNAPKVQ
jgi:hypothetical protein